MIINLKTPKPQKLLFSANDEVGKYSRVSLLNLHHVLLNAWKCIEFWGLLTLNKMATKYFRVQNSKSHVAYFIWWTEINRTPLHISFPENPRGLQGIDSIFLDPKSHWFYVNLNDQKTSHFYWCIPGMLETCIIPPKKEFLKSHGRFLK